MTFQELVGNRIAELRKQKHLSQQDLANDANIERPHLSIIESGKKNISLSTLQRITMALGVSSKEFFGSSEFEGWYEGT